MLTFSNVMKTWQQFISHLDIAKTRQNNEDFDKSLRNVLCAELWALSHYSIKASQSIFYNSNNDLYTINLELSTNKGWNIATSMNLNLYNFNVQKGNTLFEE